MKRGKHLGFPGSSFLQIPATHSLLIGFPGRWGGGVVPPSQNHHTTVTSGGDGGGQSPPKKPPYHPPLNLGKPSKFKVATLVATWI